MAEPIATATTQPNGEVVPAAAAAATPAPGVVAPTPSPDGMVPDAAAAAAAAVSDLAQAKWYEALPEEAREGFSEFETPEAARAALEVGKTVNTATCVEDYAALTLGPEFEGKEDGGAIERYKAHCLKEGISPEKAQNTLDYQKGELAAAREQLLTVGNANLAKLWGGSDAANREKALVAVATIDRAMGGRFAPAMKAAGLVDDPIVVEAMHIVSTFLGEDMLGAGGPGGANDGAPETTIGAYQKLFNTPAP